MYYFLYLFTSKVLEFNFYPNECFHSKCLLDEEILLQRFFHLERKLEISWPENVFVKCGEWSSLVLLRFETHSFALLSPFTRYSKFAIFRCTKLFIYLGIHSLPHAVKPSNNGKITLCFIQNHSLFRMLFKHVKEKKERTTYFGSSLLSHVDKNGFSNLNEMSAGWIEQRKRQ